MNVRVVELSAGQTHDLRRRVLRDGDPTAPVEWVGDDSPSTLHLGLVDDDGTIVAISTWLRDGDAVQLRGMATETGLSGRGLGATLLAAGVERADRSGAARIWANARTTALAFYVRHGFVAEGPEFVTPDTGLPHRRVERRTG